LFFSRLVLPRVGAPRVTFVTKTAMKCMRPHSLGDSTPKEFFSHFSRSVRVENPTASLPSLHVLVSGRERYTLGITRNTLPSFAAAKILTPLRGDTTPLHSFDRNRSPFCEKQKRLQVGRARKDFASWCVSYLPDSFRDRFKDLFVQSYIIMQWVQCEHSALECTSFQFRLLIAL